ncbi:Hypothetical protein R9X50_00145900 [Acrodontium crateriforme]|uniref:Calcineurin-like phosphoesterase domain-containing protein n=1 Tax=Acrodontium crateriforme TaxID=150365 RepID=A0AAQ3M563_9PEZI|nr:Hypothetical protein R9X50_00145900 [Acrodontium crateriforme]
MASTTDIQTRFLIISDTHGQEFPHELKPQVGVDVAIHCGDITQSSTLEEFKTGLRLLGDINAPLKLIISGNHEFSLDTPIFKKRISEVSGNITAEDIKKGFGDFGEARQLFETAKSKGIVFLDEGIYHFNLQNGASLTVYASPHTPSMSALDEGAFQYDKEQDHSRQWPVEPNVDIIITHGPPKGIFDRALDSDDKMKSIGSASLFAAIFQSRPKMHCFGHVHRAWGAKLVTWRNVAVDRPSHLNAIDNEASHVVETLDSLLSTPFDSALDAVRKRRKLERFLSRRCCTVEDMPKAGEQTLFINAAIEGDECQPMHLPWVATIGLPAR